jgi:N-acetylglucosaminylphosphatidylinositol deacetylase
VLQSGESAYSILLIGDERDAKRIPSKYASTNPEAPVTYMVASTWLFRKYTLLGDLPLTSFPFLGRILQALISPASVADTTYGNKALEVNTWHRYLKTREAFRNHNSQYSWDRDLYLIFSRYVWFNNLQRVERLNT